MRLQGILVRGGATGKSTESRPRNLISKKRLRQNIIRARVAMGLLMLLRTPSPLRKTAARPQSQEMKTSFPITSEITRKKKI